jgi:hypothetical protein
MEADAKSGAVAEAFLAEHSRVHTDDITYTQWLDNRNRF